MRQKTIIHILITAIILATMAAPLYAQQEVYVDAPIVDQQQPQAAQGPPAGNFRDQYSWGMINYGFTNNVYQHLDSFVSTHIFCILGI